MGGGANHIFTTKKSRKDKRKPILSSEISEKKSSNHYLYPNALTNRARCAKQSGFLFLGVSMSTFGYTEKVHLQLATVAFLSSIFCWENPRFLAVFQVQQNSVKARNSEWLTKVKGTGSEIPPGGVPWCHSFTKISSSKLDQFPPKVHEGFKEKKSQK